MAKIRVLYLLSLLLLVGLIGVTVLKPMSTGRRHIEISRESLLETADGWVIQFDLFNRRQTSETYTVRLGVDGNEYRERFQVGPAESYVYVHHVPSGGLSSGQVTVSIFRDGEDGPIEQATYYLE